MLTANFPMIGRNLTRRAFVRNMLLGSGILSFPEVLRQQAEASLSPLSSTGKQRSLILLWQDGGPSHFETFDPKPDAPAGIRGELGAIGTTLPGVGFCEILPRLARIAHRFSLIRSLHQPSSGHVDGSHNVLTGWDGATIGGKSRYPDLASVIHRMRSGVEDTATNIGSMVDPSVAKGIRFGNVDQNQSTRLGQLPHYISLGNGIHRGGSAYLGEKFGPFSIVGDPSRPFFAMKEFQETITQQRLFERWKICRILSQTHNLDDALRELDTNGALEGMDGVQQQAFDLLTGAGAAARAFDLTREPSLVRERYGLHTAGQQALLARRLVESGVSVVAVRFCPDGRGDYERSGIGWDDHAVHGNIFDIMRKRGPKFDQSLSALIEDLDDRGLSDEVLLVLVGEFGRTPRIHNHRGCPGREHWGPAGCALVYGGGLKMGQVIGSTNNKGEHPQDRPLKTQRLLATIYDRMGISTEHTFKNPAGRSIPILPDAEPIEELVV